MIAGLVRRGATVFLLTVCILIFGMQTYDALPREASPDVEIPVVMVTTPYVGVSPEDIESLVTNPIEDELAGLKDLKKMSSTSAEGISLITLEFEPEVVIEDAEQLDDSDPDELEMTLDKAFADPPVQFGNEKTTLENPGWQ